MNERIKKVRKVLDLTQQEFADKLSVKRNTVATYERGKSVPSDAAVILICKTFNVSETWLRTGEGEMFVKQTQDEALASQIRKFLSGGTDSFRERFVSLLLRLEPEQWDVLEDYMMKLIETKTPSASVPKPSSPAPPDTDIMSELAELKQQNKEIKRQNEEIRQQNQELAAKVAAMEEDDKARGLWDGSSASQSASAGSFDPARSAKR